MHVSGASNVADHLSRIPGMETLPAELSCSMISTLAIAHFCDTDVTKDSSFSFSSLNNVISVFDDSTLLKSV